MDYWFLTLPREDIEHCIRIGTFGLKQKHILHKLHCGDGVACCTTKGDWKIIALGRVTETYYTDDSRIFLNASVHASYPHRFKFQAEMLPEDAEIDAKPVIAAFSFVSKPEYWGAYFQNGIRGLSKEDWHCILQAFPESFAHFVDHSSPTNF